MRFNKNIILSIILFLSIQIYPLGAQSMFEGDYVLVQYVAENYGFRSTMHYLTSIDGDSTGTYLELFREEGEPDSGKFSYNLHEYRTFTIDDSIGLLQGNIDDQGDVFSLVGPEDEGGYFGIGIRKSSGNSVDNLSGQYWVAEFNSDDENYFEQTALDVIDFDGAGSATLYQIHTSSGEPDSFEFSYSVDDDGMINLDGFLNGILSPDGQVWVAAASDSGNHTYIYGIKIGSDLDDSALNGPYNYTQYYAENSGWDDQESYYGILNFDGLGTGVVTMAMGEAQNDTFYYAIGDDGLSDTDSLLAAVGADQRYFLTVELLDLYSVSFGFGIKGIDPATGIKKDKDRVPEKITLAQNYPNPFNPRTIINYELPITNDVELSVYNLLGQKIVTLVSERQKAGHYQVEWDATGFASGVYFYRLTTSENIAITKKMMLVR